MTATAQPQDYSAVMKNALQQIRELKAKLAEAEKQKAEAHLLAEARAKHEPIALIGIGCRFPGGQGAQDIRTPEAFWTLLRNGGNAVTETPADRWDLTTTFDPDPMAPGKTHIRHGSFLAEVDGFEPQFFTLAPREAITLDPQQRLLLETSWEALEHANIVPGTLVESATGVFVGISGSDYGTLLLQNDAEGKLVDDLYGRTGVDSSVAAGRLSYVLGLTGPCMAIDTACSSSLVAIHQACQSLRQHECTLALAGGVALMLSPENTIAFAKAGMLAADGRCKTFDAAADGYVRGEGCGMVVLKRLRDAERDGDTILAVIRGSMINHDGPSSGLTVPRGPSQQAVLRQALQGAAIDPAAVSYIEAHGTGTALGDPIELGALRAVFRNRTTPLWVSSVKPNIGHLEAAAGIAGLIKVVLMLQHEQIPPHLHLQTPTPHIDWATMPVQIPTTLTDWAVPQPGAERIAGVSSFGYSGTNAHVLLSSPPAQAKAAPAQPGPERPLHLLTLAAKTAPALVDLVKAYQTLLADTPETRLADLCYTAHTSRSHFPHRLALTAASITGLQGQLAQIARGEDVPGVTTGYAIPDQAAPKLAFLFTGQGSQYVNMGRELYASSPTFRTALDRCEALYQAYAGESLLAVLYPKTGDWRLETRDSRPVGTRETRDNGTSHQSLVSSLIDDTTYTQPALFALEYALATLWQSWGVQPAILIGHSVGEVAAACVAGVFSLEDGMKLIAARGRLMGALPPIGAMIAVTASEAEVQRAIAPYDDRVAIAAVNGPTSIVIAGQRDAINAVATALTAETGQDDAVQNRAQGAPAKIKNLTVSHAFHSPLMDPMLDEFRQVAESITYHPPRLPLIANVTGQLAGAEITTPDYWVRHVRDAVRFADGITTLLAQGIDLCLEIGPKPTLLGLAQAILDLAAAPHPAEIQNPKSKIQNPGMLPSLREQHPAWQTMLSALGQLYVHGGQMDWAGFDRDYQHRKVTLPTYPFQRQRYWIETTAVATNGANHQTSLTDWLAPHSIEALTEQMAQQHGFDAATRPTVTKVLTALAAESRTQQMLAQAEPLLYEVAWHPQPLPLPVQPPATPGRWLLFADTLGVGAALAAQLTALGEQVDVVADTSAALDDSALADLIAPVVSRRPLRGLVHLWALDTSNLDNVSSLLDRQQQMMTSVLASVQKLATRAIPVNGAYPRIWLVTQGAQSLSAAPVVPAQTALWGLGRVIALEHGELWGGLVDLEESATATASATALLAELLQTAPDGENQIAYRAGTRYGARLVRSALPKAPHPVVTIHADALYLVTGGLGALGVLVAEWLAAQGARHLLLTGRRGITTAPQQTLLDQLTAQGVTVQVAQVDVADETAMRTLFTQIAAAALPLKGVFHTAGILDDAILLNQQWARFAPVFAPKVAGGWLLHQLTADLDLDFLVFFSSATALLGHAGQSNYAAANAFLDGLAHYRRQQGLPALSINWGAWANSGMAARTLQSTLDQSQQIAPQVGMTILAHLLRHGTAEHSQIAVTPMDWAAIEKGQGVSSPFYANFVTPKVATKHKVALVEALAALPPNRRVDQLQRYLQQALGRVLAMTDLPHKATGFADLGLDSLMALEFRRHLERELDRPLPTTIAFEYPTVEKLAAYLLTEVLVLATPTAAPAPAASGHEHVGLGSADPIAVISLACRFPGADTPEAFWQLLCHGLDLVREVPPSRWAVDEFYAPQRPLPGKMYTRSAALIDAVDQFDPLFFGIAPREAVGMDPQHRLLLEVSWEALERAGLAQQTLIDSRTGVFVGIGDADYATLIDSSFSALDSHAATNNGHSIAAGRLAYTLGLQGPTLAVDTACSSSLVALHLACQSLRSGECDLALAGGVNLILSPASHIALSQMQALSPDGRCKSFDAAADGYGRGEGGGMVLLKRLSEAEREGDAILAVIKGSAVNHDGSSSGLTVPNKLAQEKLLRQALTAAQVTPAEIAYIEAHGTGTPLGDPIELRALGAVFTADRAQPLLVGSVKTNIGHLEAAAGIAGFIKTVLALHHRQLPAHLHFAQPNPYIEWAQLAIAVPTSLQPWPAGNYTAGISSFGISGTNAHIIVAAPDAGQKTEGQKTEDRGEKTEGQERPRHVLTLSAKSATALTDLAERYLHYVQTHPTLDLGNLCYTAAVGRNHFAHRLAIVATDQSDLQTKLAMGQATELAPAVLQGMASEHTPKVAYLFTGQGSQYVNMGRELYATSPTFRTALDRCEALYREYTGESLLAVLYPEQKTEDRRQKTEDRAQEPGLDAQSKIKNQKSKIDDTTYTQPALFALEYALATLWQSWGVQPAILIGHSVGEVAAACVAGVFSLEDGMKLIAARGRLMGALPQDGAMIAVMANEAEVQRAIAPYADRVAIAAVNGPESLVISGQRDAVNAVAATLTAEAIQDDAIQNQKFKIKNLAVSHAFHSPLMEPMLEAFRQVAQSITYQAPKLPLIANVTGQLAGDEIMTAEYWVRHVREAVRFADGVTTLLSQEIDLCLEIGPKPVLLGMAQSILDLQFWILDSADAPQPTEIQNPKSKIQNPGMLPSLREQHPAWQTMLTALGNLYVHGAPIDWAGFDRDYQHRKVTLPTYPFQRQRYWVDTAQRQRKGDFLSPLLDKMVQLPATHETLFETALSAAALPFLRDHRVEETIVAPGACHLAMVLNAAMVALPSADVQRQHLRLTDVIFPQALTLGENETRTVQIQLSPPTNVDQQEMRFQLHSFADTATGSNIATTLHAQGSVAMTSTTATAGLTLGALQARYTAVADVDALLAADRSPLVFGPTFRWLDAAWHAPQQPTEVLTRLRRPAAITSLTGYPLHPGLLDGCFQTTSLIPQGAMRAGELWLPFAVAALQFAPGADSSTSETWWCHTEQVGTSEWNLRLFDEQGQPLVEILGFQLRATSSTALQAARLRTEWLFTLDWQATPLPTVVSTRLPDCWLLVGEAAALHTRLTATASPVFAVAHDADLQPTVAAITEQHRTVGVIYLGTPVGERSVVAQTYDLCNSLLQVTQALLATELAVQLWVVTQGSQQPVGTATITTVAGGALWGFARSLMLEQPRWQSVCIDVDHLSGTMVETLYQEIMAALDNAACAPQVAYANGTRYVAHLAPWQAPVSPTLTQPMRLQLQAYGSLDNLHWRPLTRRAPGAGEIELAVKAVGLNFRDVLNALGLLQEYYATVLGVTQAQAVGLGFECAGVVTAVGEGVSHLAVGNRVMGLGALEGTFADYLTLPAAQMTRIPDAISDREAATIPLTFLTAWYGLVELAQLQPGERVLIHAAAGGVGQAAVQIAQAIGAEIFATASPGKWDFLRQQGVTHLLNSRTLDFADELLSLTAGQGVDVVLNSLNGDFIERSFAALGQRGRFVEIGKIGIWSNAQVAAHRPDARYQRFDLGEALEADPPLYARLWQAITAGLQAGTLRPLPQTVFPLAETVAAFRYMQQAKQIGKVVVDLAQPAAITLHADATYLITGGLGALGLQIAQQLAAAGARRLVLAGRQGATTASQQQALTELAEAGVQVAVIPADLADAHAVKLLIDRCTALAPLRGIVHAAGVLDDGVLTTQTSARFAAVMRPKVEGLWHLHTITAPMKLDFFVCFSSIAALLGAAGQSNYAAANAFMDTLMQQRRQQGLPGLSINWGPWAEIGMAAGLQSQMNAQGLTMIPVQQGRQLFHYLLERGAQVRSPLGVIPQQRTQAAPPVRAARTVGRDLVTELQELPAAERAGRIATYLRGEMATVLGLGSVAAIDARTRLFDLGMDSLMAVELRNRIEAGLRCAVRATLLFDYPTVEALTAYLLKDVLKLPETATAAKPLTGKQSPVGQNANHATVVGTTVAEPIAIIGMACHYPGGVDSPAAFWQQLLAGFDGISDLPAQRAADMPASALAQTTNASQRGGFLAQVDAFDPTFFGISPREVVVMDPAHRLLLETAWQALEEANLIPGQLFNQAIGVFVGGGTSDYLKAYQPEQADLYAVTGNTPSTAAGRLSYVLGFTGPAMAIDTACSSSLVAIHLACQSLRNGECEAALAGGVTLILEQETTTLFASGNMLSSDGRCKTFDAAADGYVRGEGCGLLVLKRLADAEADGDTIVAVIRGTAVNQDGPSSGLTVPNGPAQERVIRRALTDAGLTPPQVSYIEAHGTGTPLGDPIEIGAISTVFAGRTTPLYVGSVKTNIGHLEAAAGVAGLMKVALALRHGLIPPHLHLHTPNPHIDWAATPVRVPTALTPWPTSADADLRVGGISSFGFSGTNAHIVVAEAPREEQGREDRETEDRKTEDRETEDRKTEDRKTEDRKTEDRKTEDRKTEDRKTAERAYHLLTIATKTAGALQAYAQRYVDLLAAHPDLNLGDLCYTSHVGRSHYQHRLGLTASSITALQQQLTDYLATSAAPGLSQGVVSATQAPAKIAFLFTGQGAQYVNMGRELYAANATFRATLDRCEALYQAYTGESLLAVLYPEQKTENRKQSTEDRAQALDLDEPSKIQNPKSKIDDTTYTQPALFALEYALATLWQAWGVQPDLLIGHSVGEVAAACVAGVFSLEDGMKLIAARGRLMGALPHDGAMIAVTADEATVRHAIAPYTDQVAIAAINGPTSIVISGQRDAVNAVAAVLTTQTGTDAGSTIQNQKSKIKNLTVSHAFHSPLMEPMLDAFRQVAESITYHTPKLPLVSNVTGQLAGAEIMTAEYWVRHVRDTVRFADGVTTLLAQGIDLCLEIGPKPVLVGMAQSIFDLRFLILDSAAAPQPAEIQNQKSKIKNPILLPSLREQHPAWQTMLSALGNLYVHGAPIDWAGFDQDYQHRKVTLPTYPFQRQRYWIKQASTKRRGAALTPLIDKMIKSPAIKETLFETALSLETLPFLTDHRIDDTVVAPGACHLAMILSAAAVTLGPQMYHLTDVMFPQPLLLDDQETRTAQVIFTSLAVNGAGPHAAARLISFATNDDDAPLATHATGTVGILDAIQPEQETLTALQARCTAGIALTPDPTAALQFGPTFQWLEQAWRPVGQPSDQQPQRAEVLVKVRRPAAVESLHGYPLHPGLLDACFQAVGLALDPASQSTALMLPFALASLALYRTASGDTWWCHVEQVAAEKWKIRLFDQSGQRIADIQEFQLRAVPAGALQSTRLRTDWLYTLAWQAAPLMVISESAKGPDSWLILGRGELADALVAQVQALAPATAIFRTGINEAASDGGAMHRLVNRIAAQQRSVGVIFLGDRPADETTTPVPEQTLDFCSALLHVTQALVATTLTARLWLVTNNCQPVNEKLIPLTGRQRGQATTAAVAGALWGLGRTLAQEQPLLHTVCIDLAHDADATQQAALLRQEFAMSMHAPQPATQVAYRAGQRYVAQVQPWQAPKGLDPAQPMRLQLTAYGSLENLQWTPMTRRQPGPGEVEIAVKAAGLNFRDVLNALGMLQAYYATVLGITNAQAVGLGFECAGVVTAVGPGVRDFAVGDRVMGLSGAEGAFASYLTAPAAQMTFIPAGISDAAAATLPLTFLTAWYGLVELAQLQAGDRVLIHAAAGGVGQAAVQIAQAMGAEIFATASPGKWDFLRQQGIVHLMNSRTLDFATEIAQITGGRGVDVVLNSLNGAFIEQSLAVLGTGGRFVEIGKLGIWSREQMQHQRADVAYHPFDLGEALAAEPALAPRLWQAITGALQAGTLQPLPLTTFPAQESVAAFRYMQAAKQTGKLVLTFGEATPVVLHKAATYLITGGLGALGLQIAQQLVADGAQHLVLTGRRGVTTAEQQQVLAQLDAAGADVHVVAADIVEADAVERLLLQCSQIAPLRGIVHAAGLLDDGVLTGQTRDRFAAVMQPKVAGAWHLHTLTAVMPLDFFVCFSSAAALLGAPGQSNYAAANAFLDTLMHERQSAGRPGLSINWGAWAEIGMAAGLQAHLNAQGMNMIAPPQGRLLFRHLLQQPVAQIGVLPLRRQQPTAEQPVTRANMREQLNNLPEEERRSALEAYLRGAITAILGLPAATPIDPQTRLFDFGFDSLMAVEMKNKLEAGLACSLRSTVLFDYPTLSALTPYLLADVLGLVTTPALEIADEQPLAPAESAPADLDEISEDELSDLLLAKLDRLGY